jgi:type I restriction enzyme S subunit
MSRKALIGQVTLPVATWDPCKSGLTEEIQYIDIASVDRETKQINAVPMVPASVAPSRARQLVEAGDVLVSTVRPNLNAVAQIRSEHHGATASTGFTVLRPIPNLLDGGYLFHWVRTPTFVDEMVRLATGASYPAVSDRIVKESEIPLPPLAEQKHIAAILDKADAIRRKRQAAIKLADDFLRATFLDMFGDPVTNPKGWEVKPLEAIVNFKTGKLDSNAAVKGGFYPFFTCSRENFQIDTYAFDCEALLLAGNNAAAEYSVKYYKGKFNAYQRTYIITTKGSFVTYRYLQHALEMKLQDLKRLSKGTNTKYLTLGILNNVQLQVPSKQSLVSFDRIIEKIEVQRNKLQNSAQMADINFNSLTQRAFRGEL